LLKTIHEAEFLERSAKSVAVAVKGLDARAIQAKRGRLRKLAGKDINLLSDNLTSSRLEHRDYSYGRVSI
jgi:hypothetical protein